MEEKDVKDVVVMRMRSPITKKILSKLITNILRKKVKCLQINVEDITAVLDEDDTVRFRVEATGSVPKKNALDALGEVI